MRINMCQSFGESHIKQLNFGIFCFVKKPKGLLPFGIESSFRGFFFFNYLFRVFYKWLYQAIMTFCSLCIEPCHKLWRQSAPSLSLVERSRVLRAPWFHGGRAVLITEPSSGVQWRMPRWHSTRGGWREMGEGRGQSRGWKAGAVGWLAPRLSHRFLQTSWFWVMYFSHQGWILTFKRHIPLLG